MGTTETHTLRILLIRAPPQRRPTLTLPQTPEPTTATTQEEAGTTRPSFPTYRRHPASSATSFRAELALREVGTPSLLVRARLPRTPGRNGNRNACPLRREMDVAAGASRLRRNIRFRLCSGVSSSLDRPRWDGSRAEPSSAPPAGLRMTWPASGPEYAQLAVLPPLTATNRRSRRRR